MPVAIFDNPHTLRRETWLDKRLISSVSFNFYFEVHSIDWLDDVVQIVPGHLTGMISALPVELIQYVRWIRRAK